MIKTKKIGSKFLNNSDIIQHTLLSNFNFAGALFFQGEYLSAKSCIFRRNIGSFGGALSITYGPSYKQTILVENCIITENFSDEGGFIGFLEYLSEVSTLITHNFFQNNLATCFLFIIFLSFNQYQDGGNIRMRSFAAKIVTEIKNNYFGRSFGVWGSIFNFDNCFSVLSEDNIFLDSITRSFVGNNFGTGGLMFLTSSFIGKNNLYYNLWVEHKG